MPKARHGQHVGDQHGRHGIIESILGHVARVVWRDGSTSDVPTDALHRKGFGCAVFVFAFCVGALSLGLTTIGAVWIA